MSYLISFAQKIVSLIVIALLCLTISFTYHQPAFATIRQQEESTGQLLYQARHRLQDNQGQTWQLILFKRVKDGQVKDVDLRLVGFPDQVNFIHPQNLTLQTQDGTELTAPDQFSEKAPAPNVGQYDLQEILLNLTQEKSLKLKLPVEENLSLNIPYPVLLEWEQIANY
jgi:hypothetical protein